MVRRVMAAVASLFDRRFDPARARNLPLTDEAGQSTARDQYPWSRLHARVYDERTESD